MHKQAAFFVNLASFRRLFSKEGENALAAAVALQPRETDFLQHLQALSRKYPLELARAALETAVLRLEGASKFPQAASMYLSRQALEQASSHEISAYRAERFRDFEWRVDLGCSIGGDTLGLASQGKVVGIDLDPLRLAMARLNLEACGFSDRASFIQADLNDPLPLSAGPGAAIFFDPARRSGGKRIHSVRNYTPPLAILQNWLPTNPALGVKISPGVDLSEITGFDCEVEFISLRGELKEAVLWFGPFKTARRRATLLPGPITMAEGQELKLELSDPRLYIYEPDPAILRAGMVAALGAKLGATQMDPDIAYLTADRHVATPFARAWQIIEWYPFNLKKLRSALRLRGVGRLVVKKRGSPLEPEALIQSLRLSGDKQALIFLTHLRGRPIVILAQAITPVSS